MRTNAIALVALAAAAFGPLPAAHELALNLVWSRVADVHGEAGSVESAEFSPDGRFIVSGAKFDNSVIMWRVSDGAEIWRAYAAAEVERVGWSPDGKLVAACSEDALVTIFDAATGAVVKKLPQRSALDALAWSKKGRWLAVGEEHVRGPDGGVSGRVLLYRMPEGTLEREADFGETINELAFTSDDGLLAAAGHDGRLRIYSTADMALVHDLKCDPSLHQVCVDISPDDRFVATGGFGGMIWVFELPTGRLVKKFNQTGRKIETVAWSRDGQYLFSAGHDPSIHITRLSSILDPLQKDIMPAYRSIPTDYMEYLHVSPNGAFLTSAHQDGMVRLWVFMNEDPNLNTRRHQWVGDQQRREFGTPTPASRK